MESSYGFSTVGSSQWGCNLCISVDKYVRSAYKSATTEDLGKFLEIKLFYSSFRFSVFWSFCLRPKIRGLDQLHAETEHFWTKLYFCNFGLLSEWLHYYTFFNLSLYSQTGDQIKCVLILIYIYVCVCVLKMAQKLNNSQLRPLYFLSIFVLLFFFLFLDKRK